MVAILTQVAKGVQQELQGVFIDCAESYKEFYKYSEHQNKKKNLDKQRTRSTNFIEKTVQKEQNSKSVLNLRDERQLEKFMQSYQAVLKENDAEIADLKKKLEKEKEINISMRTNFLKELVNVKEAAFMETSQRKFHAQKTIKFDIHKDLTDAREYLKVKYFTPTEGLTQEISDSFNTNIAEMKAQFERKMHVINDLNYELRRTVTFYEMKRKTEEMASEELIHAAFLRKDKDELKMWFEIKKNMSRKSLEMIAEAEFDDYIRDISKQKIQDSVREVRRECDYQLQSVQRELKSELNNVRIQLKHKQVEIRDYDQKMSFQLSKANGEGYEKAEKKLRKIIEEKDLKHSERLRNKEITLRKEFAALASEQSSKQFLYMFDKWRMITTILKIREGNTDSDLVKGTVQSFVDRSSRAFHTRISKLEQENHENKALVGELQLQVSDRESECAQQESRVAITTLEKVKVEQKLAETEEERETFRLKVKQIQLVYEQGRRREEQQRKQIQEYKQENEEMIDQLTALENALNSAKKLAELAEKAAEKAQNNEQQNKEQSESACEDLLLEEGQEVEPNLSHEDQMTLLKVQLAQQEGRAFVQSQQNTEVVVESTKTQGKNGSDGKLKGPVVQRERAFNAVLYASEQVDDIIEQRQGMIREVYTHDQRMAATDTEGLIQTENTATQCDLKLAVDVYGRNQAAMSTVSQELNQPYSNAAEANQKQVELSHVHTQTLHVGPIEEGFSQSHKKKGSKIKLQKEQVKVKRDSVITDTSQPSATLPQVTAFGQRKSIDIQTTSGDHQMSEQSTERHENYSTSQISSPKRPAAIYNIITDPSKSRSHKKRNASSQARRKVDLSMSLADRRRNAHLHYSQVNKKAKETKPASPQVVPTVFKRIWDKQQEAKDRQNEFVKEAKEEQAIEFVRKLGGQHKLAKQKKSGGLNIRMKSVQTGKDQPELEKPAQDLGWMLAAMINSQNSSTGVTYPLVPSTQTDANLAQLAREVSQYLANKKGIKSTLQPDEGRKQNQNGAFNTISPEMTAPAGRLSGDHTMGTLDGMINCGSADYADDYRALEHGTTPVAIEPRMLLFSDGTNQEQVSVPVFGVNKVSTERRFSSEGQSEPSPTATMQPAVQKTKTCQTDDFLVEAMIHNMIQQQTYESGQFDIKRQSGQTPFGGGAAVSQTTVSVASRSPVTNNPNSRHRRLKFTETPNQNMAKTINFSSCTINDLNKVPLSKADIRSSHNIFTSSSKRQSAVINGKESWVEFKTISPLDQTSNESPQQSKLHLMRMTQSNRLNSHSITQTLDRRTSSQLAVNRQARPQSSLQKNEPPIMAGLKAQGGLKSLASNSSEDLLKGVEVLAHERNYKKLVTQAFPNHPQAIQYLDHDILTEEVISGYQDSTMTPQDLVNTHTKPNLQDYGNSRTPNNMFLTPGQKIKKPRIRSALQRPQDRRQQHQFVTLSNNFVGH